MSESVHERLHKYVKGKGRMKGILRSGNLAAGVRPTEQPLAVRGKQRACGFVSPAAAAAVVPGLREEEPAAGDPRFGGAGQPTADRSRTQVRERLGEMPGELLPGRKISQEAHLQSADLAEPWGKRVVEGGKKAVDLEAATAGAAGNEVGAASALQTKRMQQSNSIVSDLPPSEWAVKRVYHDYIHGGTADRLIFGHETAPPSAQEVARRPG